MPPIRTKKEQQTRTRKDGVVYPFNDFREGSNYKKLVRFKQKLMSSGENLLLKGQPTFLGNRRKNRSSPFCSIYVCKFD